MKKTDELEAHLAQAQTQREKIDALNDLAWELRYQDAERSLALAQQAYDLANTGEFLTTPYAMGQAASLTTRAHLDRNGRLDEALNKCFQALALIEHEAPNPVVVKCVRMISWLYFYLNEYSSALTYGLKALDLAQAGNFKDLTAAAFNSLTMVFAVTGDLNQARKMHGEAVEIAREIHDETLELVALNNGAIVLSEQGELDQALELAAQAWEIAQRVEVSDARADVSDTMGQILQKMGEFDRAEQLLMDALEIDIEAGHELGQANDLLGLGKFHLSQKRLEQARMKFEASLALSKKIGSRQFEMECHAQLYQIAEQQGRWEQAFAYLKTFYNLYEKNHNETTSKKLALLKVAHQVETAKRDAEIYHLRNEELLREIEERKQMEQVLHRLANTDSLTGLHNRRYFFDEAGIILKQAIRYHHPLSVLLLDIDHFKQINDSYGHAAGDQAIRHLAEQTRETARVADLTARLGGDEFVVLLPETEAVQAQYLAQRLQQRTREHAVIVTAGFSFYISISIGITELMAPATSPSIDGLLEMADRALYQAKANGRGRVNIYQPSATT